MKKVVVTFSVAVLFLCAVASVYLCFGGRRPVILAVQLPSVSEVSTEPVAAAQTAQAFLIDQRRTINLVDDSTLLAELSPRERRDQHLDWLFFTALLTFLPSTNEFNRATFDLPTSRQGYMHPLGNFEYGDTRSKFVGEGAVLALIPASTDERIRKDNLAHIADEQRKNLGRPFDRLFVIEYQLDEKAATAALTRRTDVDYATLFSPAYGYLEQEVTTASDLTAFLNRIDDLTASRKSGNGLILGGRKILGQKARGVTIEEIATIWQAERKIQTNSRRI